MNNMLTIEEVKKYLELDQAGVEQLLENGKLHAYKIGGSYIRFRKEDVMNLRYEYGAARRDPQAGFSFLQRVHDFWRFNNFYIVSLALVALLIYFIVGI